VICFAALQSRLAIFVSFCDAFLPASTGAQNPRALMVLAVILYQTASVAGLISSGTLLSYNVMRARPSSAWSSPS
jgi:hypothetical protein